MDEGVARLITSRKSFIALRVSLEKAYSISHVNFSIPMPGRRGCAAAMSRQRRKIHLPSFRTRGSYASRRPLHRRNKIHGLHIAVAPHEKRWRRDIVTSRDFLISF
jgi:hypothetical protein